MSTKLKKNNAAPEKEKEKKKFKTRKPLERDEEIGRRMSDLRRTLKLTQKEFGEKINMPPTSISAYERNLKNPLVNVLSRIQEHYNANLTWIISGKGTMFVEDDIKAPLADSVREEAPAYLASPPRNKGFAGMDVVGLGSSRQEGGSVICVSCDYGADNAHGVDQKFCPQCSGQLISSCHHCGSNILFSGARFCTSCRAPLKQG